MYELASKVGRSPAVVPSPQHSPKRGHSASPNKESIDLTGEWAGVYNGSVAMKLIVLDTEATEFRGRIEYPSDQTITIVQGTVHENWSRGDEIWAQISDGTVATHPLAVIFRETEYECRGSGAVDFGGEYRGLVSGKAMAGAWFSGKRLVGVFTFERSVAH